MIKLGLLDEVKRLRMRPAGWSKEAQDAVGYKEVLAYLQGKLRFEDAREKINTNTWHFARRQLTWLKSFKEGIWLELTRQTLPGQLVEEILKNYQ
jgi:tRNA dimethylallyltransferase